MKCLNNIFQLKRGLFLSIILVVSALNWITPEVSAASSVEVRDDGLTVAMTEPLVDVTQKIPANDYLVMLLKTGSAYDPEGKQGLTVLTTEILAYVFRFTGAVVQYQTLPEFTIYLFKVPHLRYQDFCKGLDAVVRLDALLYNDLCNELVLYHQNEPQPPANQAYYGLMELLYGKGHPYFTSTQPDYSRLNINDVNVWFRKVYQPQNMIIASTEKLPDDFLRRPSGRNLKDAVNLGQVPLISTPKTTDFKWQTIHDNVSTIEIGFIAPAMGEKGFFSNQLIKYYLQKDLWNQLRETAGFCYDVQVVYSYLETPAAPAIIISFQAMPGDTESAIRLVIDRLKRLADDGISGEELKTILEKEKCNLIFQADYPLHQVTCEAFYALYRQNWLDDEESYFDQLSRNTNLVSQILIRELAGLKISIAGPEEAMIDVKRIKQALDFGEKLDK